MNEPQFIMPILLASSCPFYRCPFIKPCLTSICVVEGRNLEIMIYCTAPSFHIKKNPPKYVNQLDKCIPNVQKNYYSRVNLIKKLLYIVNFIFINAVHAFYLAIVYHVNLHFYIVKI